MEPETAPLTIGKLAHASGVGVETVRYYQERGLLPVPARSGAYRYYLAEIGNRIRFIKRAELPCPIISTLASDR